MHSENNYSGLEEAVKLLENESAIGRLKEKEKEKAEIVEKFLSEAEKTMKIRIKEEMYGKISGYMLILLSHDGKNAPCKNLGAIKFLTHTEEYVVIEMTMKKVLRDFDTDFMPSEETLIQIADLLNGYILNNFENNSFEIWLNEEIIVKEIISNISGGLKKNLENDEILFGTLLYNIKPIIYRLKNDIKISNSTYRDLILVNDPVIEPVKEAVKVVEEIFGIDFTEEEIALISYHAKSSLKRKVYRNMKKVILVCGLGYGSSKILEQNLVQSYDLDIIDVVPYYLAGELIPCCKNVDMILTTIELATPYDIPVIKLNPILKEEDFVKLSKYGINKSRNRISLKELLGTVEKSAGIFDRDKLIEDLKKEFRDKIVDDLEDGKAGGILRKMLNADNVGIISKAENWKEAIRCCGELLVKNGIAQAEYTDEMIELVEKHGEYIVVDDGFAMPHGSVSGKVTRTGISLLVVKERVYFPSGKWANVFLSFASKNKTDYIEILNDLFRLVTRHDFVSKVSKIEKYGDLEEYFERNI